MNAAISPVLAPLVEERQANEQIGFLERSEEE
jgi:hypothetical protein